MKSEDAEGASKKDVPDLPANAELVQRVRTVEGEVEHVKPRTLAVVGSNKMVIEAKLNRLHFTHRYKPHPNFAQIIQELATGARPDEVWPNGAAYEASTSYHASLTTEENGYVDLHDFADTEGMPLFVAAGEGARFRITIEQVESE